MTPSAVSGLAEAICVICEIYDFFLREMSSRQGLFFCPFRLSF